MKKEKISVAKRQSLYKRAIPLYIMIAFPMLWYLIFCYVPMGGIIVAFKKYNLFTGIIKSPWIGLTNFKRFFADKESLRYVINTLRLGALSLLICFPAPIVLSLLINEIRGRKFKKVTQTMSYLPHFVANAALVAILVALLSPSEGIVNAIIKGLGFKPINFMVSTSWFAPLYIIIQLWMGLGWGTILYLAAIAGVDTELHEAAAIDGAGRWRRMWSITLPGILPTVSILFILSTPGIIGADMTLVLLLQKPVTLNVSQVIPTYIFNRGLLQNQFDYATAIGFMYNIVAVAILLFSNKIAKIMSGTGIW